MATQTKEHPLSTGDDSTQMNGEQPAPTPRRTAFDQLKPLFGKYKDNPHAREVLDGVLARRQAERPDDDRPDDVEYLLDTDTMTDSSDSRKQTMRQVTISIPDDTYTDAIRRAQLEGFAVPETYMADLIVSQVAADSDNYDHVFTPEVIAELDQISAEIAAGARTYALSELNDHLAANREAWLAKHPH
jgi:hypothetical protein